MKNPQETPSKPGDEAAFDARGGRLSRDEAERRRLMAAGVDHTLVDSRRILAAIAIDDEAPPGARVSAAKALPEFVSGLMKSARRRRYQPRYSALNRARLELARLCIDRMLAEGLDVPDAEPEEADDATKRDLVAESFHRRDTLPQI